MTLLKTGFENAAPAGTALIPANAGVTRVVTNTNTAVSTSTWRHIGSFAALLQAPNAVQVYVGFDFTASGQVVARGYFRFPALPVASGVSIIRLLNVDSGGGTGGTLFVNTNGSWGLQDAGQVNTVFTSPAADIAINTDYRFEYMWTVGAGTGTARGVVYVGDSTIPQRDSGTLVNQANGSVNQGAIRFGKTTSGGTWSSLYMDDLAVQDGTTTLIGVETAALTPTWMRSGNAWVAVTRKTRVAGSWV